MKAAVSVHGRYHAFDLVRELRHQNVTVSLATTYPRSVARRWIPADVPLHTAGYLELLRRAAGSLGAAHVIDLWVASRFGRFAAHSLPPVADVFVGWSGASLEAIDVARSRGMRIVIERGSSHIAHQAEILAEEYALRGIAGPMVDRRIIEREVAEYEAADVIMVPSRFAATTFERRGVNSRKLRVNPYGVDTALYSAIPIERPIRSPVRVLFVGQVGMRKGIPYLLQATEKLRGNVELHLVGPLEPGIRDLLRTSSAAVRAYGPLRGVSLRSRFQDADIFCLPSLEEGLPLALLQAMAAGLPVLVTPETGAEDVMTQGEEGFLVPSRNAEKLADALVDLLSHNKRLAMGAAARRRMASTYTWHNYGERAVAIYRSLTGIHP